MSDTAPAKDIPDDDSPQNHVRCALRHPRECARRLSQSRKGLWMIGVLSFLESTVLPFAIEIVLIPYMLARRDILWRIATVTTVGCLIGAAFGYGIGYFLYNSFGTWLVESLGWQQQFEDTRSWFESNGFWAVLAIGITPVPFQVAMLAAGAMKYSIAMFLLATAIARGIRYFGLALLVRLFGDRALDLWNRHKVPVAAGLTVVVVAVVAAQVFLGGGGGGASSGTG
jgi:membrane protein YqaA with SNARE-associated domain